jgi:predicted YcjX-like family ATPase
MVTQEEIEKVMAAASKAAATETDMSETNELLRRMVELMTRQQQMQGSQNPSPASIAVPQRMMDDFTASMSKFET